jgi:hypothetical protein
MGAYGSYTCEFCGVGNIEDLDPHECREEDLKDKITTLRTLDEELVGVLKNICELPPTILKELNVKEAAKSLKRIADRLAVG